MLHTIFFGVLCTVSGTRSVCMHPALANAAICTTCWLDRTKMHVSRRESYFVGVGRLHEWSVFSASPRAHSHSWWLNARQLIHACNGSGCMLVGVAVCLESRPKSVYTAGTTLTAHHSSVNTAQAALQTLTQADCLWHRDNVLSVDMYIRLLGNGFRLHQFALYLR